jgi:hypothetical protein
MGHSIGASFKEKKKCLTSSGIRTPCDPTQSLIKQIYDFI